MSEQIGLRRRVRMLKVRQAHRRELVAAQKIALDELLEREDRCIANLEQQLTMGVAK
jgi:hypothetical protein